MGQKTNPIGNRLGDHQRMGFGTGMAEKISVISLAEDR